MADEASNEAAAQAAETEHDRIEQLKRRCLEQLARIREQAAAGDAGDVSAGTTALLGALNDSALDHAFTSAIRTEIKSLELTANMKATDIAVRRAVAHAQGDRKLERNQEVGVARGFLARAIALGASGEFKRIAEMSIESAMLTGGVRQVGPTRAKPVDDAPPPPSLAKGERREFKRYDRPVITVTVADKSFATLDWSMGGMLVAGSTADEFPRDEPVQIELSTAGTRGAVVATVVQARVEIRRGGMGVRFFQLTPELSAYLRRLIMARGSH
ncbi:MAG: PilZ domain-containing protein [Alphaproteobacteria bacterium]|nr:PilZ domain-containing protein [Alphaproteobacteria bacterium]